MPGLWAIGEVACTGLHGANRLASNSLLEGLVFAHRAYETSERKSGGAEERKNNYRCTVALIHSPAHLLSQSLRGIPARPAIRDEQVVITQNWDEIRQLMWNYVGIVRSDKRLERAYRRIQILQQEIHEYYWNFLITPDLIELRNIATVAELVVRSRHGAPGKPRPALQSGPSRRRDDEERPSAIRLRSATSRASFR